MPETKTFFLELEAENYQVKEIMRAVIHAILFHRMLSLCRPKEVELDFVKVTYCKCDNEALDKEVDQQIQIYQSALESSTPNPYIAVTFLDRKEKRGWIFKGQQERCWERWCIRLNLHAARPTNDQDEQTQAIQFSVMLEKQLRSCLMYIATVANEYKDHVPVWNLSADDDSRPLPYRISVPNGLSESWGGILKRMIADSSLPQLLS